MKARQLRANKYFRLMIWILISSHLFWGQVVLAQSFPDNPGSVGLVSNLTGQVSLHHSYQPAIGEPLEFKGPIVYGDRVRTGEHSMLGMLIGNETLVAMQEQTELQLLQDSEKVKVVHLVNGQVCVSTKKNGAPIVIKTPEFSITIEPASMVNVNTTAPPIEGQSPVQETSYQPRLILTKSQNLHMQDSYGQLMANNDLITTVNVLEGSVSLVSNVSEKAQMIVGAEQGVQIIGNTISEPFKNPEVQCRIQDAQQNPQHGKTPKEAQEQIAEDQQRQADNLVAALFESDPAAEFQPILPPSLIVDNGVISTTEFSPPSPGESGFPATPGSPTVIFNSNNLVLDSPFLLATSGSPTVNGPPIIFALQNFSGNISNIPLSSLSNISPFVASDLLAAYGDPQNPDSLLAGIRVQNAAQEQSSILGGIAFRNSTVETSENIAEFTNANVAMGGSILELTDSTLTVSENVVSLQNSTFNASSSPPNSPLVQLNGVSSRMNVAESFLTTNPSTVIVPDGILTLTGGATATIAGSLINLESTTLDATGATNALVRVLGGSSLTVNENGVSANGSEIIVPAGVLSVDASQVETGGDFVALNNSSLSTSEALLTATSSDVTVNGAVVRLSNDSELTIPANTPVVTLTNSALMADALLGVSQPGMVPAGLLSGLVNVNGTSTVNVTGAVVQVTDVGTAGVTLASLTPLLQPIVTNGLNLTGVVLDVDTSTVTVQSDLVGLDNDAFTVSGTGVLAANNATVTVEGAVVAIENGAMFMPNGMPVVTLANSALTAEALLAVSQPGLLSTALLEGLVDADGASTVTLTEAVVQVTDVGAPGVTVASLTPVLEPTITNGLSATGVVLDVDNSLVTIQSDLVRLDNDTFTVPGAGVLAANAAEVTVDGAVVRLSNDSELTIPANTAVVTLANSALTAEALLAVSQPGLLSTALLEGLVDADGASTVTLTEAVVQVTDVGAPGVTVASLTPVLEPTITNGLSATGVVLDVDNSLVTIQSDLVGLDNDTFTVPGAGVLAANAAEVTVDGAVVRLSNDSELTIPANTAVAMLANSALTAEALLAVSQPGAVPTALLAGLVDADGPSTVTLTEAVVQIDGTSGVTVASLTPVLQSTFTNGLSATGAVLDVNNSMVMVADSLGLVDGSDVNVSGGLVRLTNLSNLDVGLQLGDVRNASLTLGGMNAGISVDNSELTLNGSAFRLENGSLNVTNGLLDIRNGGTMTVGSGGGGDGDLFLNFGQNTLTSGSTLITLDGGTLNGARISGNPGDISLTVNNGGLLTLTNESNVSFQNGFGLVFRDITTEATLFTVDNSQLDMGFASGGVLARLSESLVVNSGGLLHVNNSGNVSVHTVLNGNGITVSSGTLNGTAVVIDNQSSLNASEGFDLTNSAPATELILTINNGGLLDLQNGSSAEFDTVFLHMTDSSLTANETLIKANNSNLQIENDAFFLSQQNSSAPGTLTVTNGGLLSLTNGSVVNIGGNILEAVNETVNLGDTAVHIEGASTLNVSDVLFTLNASTMMVTGSLLEVSSQSQANIQTGSPWITLVNGSSLQTSDALLVVDNAQSISGPLSLIEVNQSEIIADGGIFNLINRDMVNFGTLVTLTNNSTFESTQALVRISETNEVDIATPLAIIDSTSQLTAGGILNFDQVGQGESEVSISSALISFDPDSTFATTAPFIQASNSVVNASVDVLSLNNQSIATFAGVLDVNNSTFNTNFDMLNINESTLIAQTGLFSATNGSTIIIGDDGEGTGSVLAMTGGTLSVLETLVSVQNSEMIVRGTAFQVFNAPGSFNEANVFSPGFDVQNGGLLSLADMSMVTVDSILMRIQTSHFASSQTLVTVDNNSTLAVQGPIVLAVDMVGFIDDGEGFVPGNFPDDGETFIPGIQVENGGVLSLSNNSQYGGGFQVNEQQVDEQLLDASSPLVTLVRSSLSTGSAFLDVNGGSTLVADLPNDALVSLDASHLIINGSLINVTGPNSVVSVTGAIFDLQNGSILDINGALVEVNAGGLFNLFGPLGRFSGGSSGTPNILSITNDVCAASTCQAPFAAFPDLRVAGDVNIQNGYNPFQGFDSPSSQLDISENGAVLVNNGGTLNLNNQNIPQ